MEERTLSDDMQPRIVVLPPHGLGTSVLGVRETIRDTGAWAAANIILSASFYLVDFATNISTLRKYHFYQFACDLSHPSNDPACSTIVHDGNNPYKNTFSVSLLLMVAAHATNSLIFWRTLNPNDHPLRMAYFLPLIYLYRLLKVLWQTCSCHSLKDFKDSQEEYINLYNILGASLETAPQLILQFHVATSLGLYHVYNYVTPGVTNTTGEPIPRVLVVSLVASAMTGTYNGSMAILSLVPKSTLVEKACIAIAGGVHTLAAMSTKAMINAALAESLSASLPLIPYFLVALAIPWILYGSLYSKINCSNKDKWWMRCAHSFALAHVSINIGPMYVVVKHFRSLPYFHLLLILGTLLHIFVDLLGVGAVLVSGRYLSGWDVPCHPAIFKDGTKEDNIYLTCNVFLGAVCPALLLLILTAVVFVVVDKGSRFRRLDEHESAMIALDQTRMSSTMPPIMLGPGSVHNHLINESESEQEQERALLSTKTTTKTVRQKAGRLLFLIVTALVFKMVHWKGRVRRSAAKGTLHKRGNAKAEGLNGGVGI